MTRRDHMEISSRGVEIAARDISDSMSLQELIGIDSDRNRTGRLGPGMSC